MSALPPVILTLSHNEALVLHDFLQRFTSSGQLALEDQAEERALWNLCCLLERTLVEPFSPDYSGLLAHARLALRDPD